MSRRSRFAALAVVLVVLALPLGWTLEGLGGCILATLFAGWYYRES